MECCKDSTVSSHIGLRLSQLATWVKDFFAAR
jgi:hypothetical protein